ncbi:MAG: cyclodeaminase/cyclohydrolase family protein [Candidatus Omnitrophota bacterium]
MYKNSSLKQYLDDLSAKLPAPGGGSAAALSGALGVGLMSMVCQFTIGKEKFKDVEGAIKEILDYVGSSGKRLLELVDEDVEAFKNRDNKKSLEVPLEVCRLASEAVNLCPDLVKMANPNLISDVGCAVDLLAAAFNAARLNVEINLKNPFAILEKENIIKELNTRSKKIERVKEEVIKNVREIIRR